MTTELKDCHVAVSVSAKALIDYIDPLTGVTVHSQETLDSMRERFPDAQVISSWDSAQRLIEKEFIHPAKRITRDEWGDLFKTQLPPVGRVGRGQTESFRLPELVFGQIGVILARDEWRFYKLHDRVDLSHDEIMAKCRAVQ